MDWKGFSEQKCQFWIDEERTARKEHVCCECNQRIPKGSRYFHIAGKWDNRFDAFDICLDCQEDWEEVLNMFRGIGEDDAIIVYGLLREAVEDAFEADIIGEDSPLVQKWLPSP